jgi:hypothetical protein
MGFWTDIFLGVKCEECGRRTIEDYRFKFGAFHMLWCRSCGVVYLDRSGRIPRCYRCGTPQTDVGENRNGVILPQCPKCGYIWDGDEWKDRR